LADGLSNERVKFKGVVKNGVAELMGVQHRRAQIPEAGMRTAMIGIVSDANVRHQKKT
jgi:hypothetical protein